MQGKEAVSPKRRINGKEQAVEYKLENVLHL